MKLLQSLSTIICYLCLSSSLLNAQAKSMAINLNTSAKLSKNHPTIYLGGFSGLCYHPKRQSYFAVTDRGPVKKAKDFDGDGIKDRTFLLPKFTPTLVELKLSSAEFKIINRYPLHYSKDELALGLPASGGKVKNEKAFGPKGEVLAQAKKGIDPEGIALGPKGNFWIVEEIGPSILKVSAQGKILKRFIPQGSEKVLFGQGNLPSWTLERKPNKGFEAVAITQNKLYTLLQNPPKKAFPSGRASLTLLEFDLALEKVSTEYTYPLRSNTSKIAAMTAMGHTLYILEQNKQKIKTGRVTLQSINLKLANPAKTLTKIPHANFARLMDKQDLKIEGLAAVRPHQFTLVLDNDFKNRTTQFYQVNL